MFASVYTYDFVILDNKITLNDSYRAGLKTFKTLSFLVYDLFF